MFDSLLSGRLIRSAVLGASVVVGSLVAAPAYGQFGRGGGPMGGMSEDPPITTKALERYAEMLKMTPDQIENAKGMLEGFNTEYTAVRTEMRQAFESMRDEARESGDNSVWRNAGQLMQGIQKKVDKIEKQYFEDVKLLLSEEQAAQWPKVERAHRREKSVPRGGLLSGEAVDLVGLVRDMKLTDAELEPIQPLLDQYEVELDRLLAERDKAYEEGMTQGAALWMNQQMDKIDELFNKARDAAAKVRDVNKRYARQVEGALPEARHADFEKNVQKASFPRVYRPNYVTRSLETALGLSDLTEEQKTQVTQLRESMEQQLEPIQKKIAASIEETEMTRSAMQMMGMGGGGAEGTQELRDLRREIEEGTYDKLKALLNDEQRTKLPERPQGGNWRRMIGGDGGGGAGGGGGGGERRNRGGN